MTANLLVIANIKQLRSYIVLEFYRLFPKILELWRPKFSNFYVFTIGLALARFWRIFRISGGGVEHPNSLSPPGTPLY